MNNDTLNKLKILTKKNVQIKSMHGSALISNGKLVSLGTNKIIKSFIVNGKRFVRTIHAELDVFSTFPKKLSKNMDIIVIRVNNQNILKNSRPCNQCIEKLLLCGIRKVYYSNEYGNIVSEFVKDMVHIFVSSGNRHKLNKKQS